MCLKRLKGIFRKGEKEEPKKEEQKLARIVSTRRGGPNMPKFQPCPQCHGQAKRESKTVGGDYYWCIKCGVAFFVNRRRRKPSRPVWQHSK